MKYVIYKVTANLDSLNYCCMLHWYLFSIAEIFVVVAGNGYYLFSAPKLQCNVGETGNATIQELEDEENTDYFKMENEMFSLWFWW